MELLAWVGVILAASALVWKGGDILEVSADRLARIHRLPPVVQGSLITAAGSSFPELSTSVLSTLVHGEFDLGMSAIVGSAIFNIVVIPGLAALAAPPLETDRVAVYKDTQFYMVAVAAVLLTFSMAALYHPVDGDGHLGEVTRALALAPVALYLLYLFLQVEDTRDHRRAEPRQEETDASKLASWGWLVASLAMITVGVEGLVRGAIFLGDWSGTPSFIWGATVVAAATSVPDAVVSVKGATRDRGSVSLANVLGSNTFDLLVALPAGVLVAGSAVVNLSVATPLMLWLTGATILLFACARRGLAITRAEAWTLLASYLLFVVWLVLETVGTMSLIPA